MTSIRPDYAPVLVTFTTEPPLISEVRVAKFTGQERISGLSHHVIDVLADCSLGSVQDFVGARAVLTVSCEPDQRQISGIVTAVRRLSHSGQVRAYSFTLAPELWLLTCRKQSRIFQDKNIHQLIDAVLRDAGLYQGRVEWRLDGAAARERPHEYCVQYAETDFAFFSRLLEREGFFYFFETDEGVGERLVITNGVTQCLPIEGNSDLELLEQDSIRGWGRIHWFQALSQIRPNALRFRDYDHQRPNQRVEARIQSEEEPPGGVREIYEYPAGYVDPERVRALAGLRLDEQRSQTTLCEGETGVVRLATGRVFRLTGHDEPELDQEYCVHSIEHECFPAEEREATAGWDRPINRTSRSGDPPEGESPPAYVARFSCVPRRLPFHGFSSTPKPRIIGAQTARVVGPEGIEIFTDNESRVKVRFHWDREEKPDERASLWIRVAQGWAGVGWGALIIPRVGMEVVVTFLEGDPDRPLITGCVYNAMHPPPNILPSEKNLTTLRSQSTPGGNGYNELTIDDTAGSEEIFLRAQNDFNQRVLHDANTRVDNDQALRVVRDQFLNVGRNQNSRIDGNQSLDLRGNQNVEIRGNQEVTIHGKQWIVVKGSSKAAEPAGDQSSGLPPTQAIASEPPSVAAQSIPQLTSSGPPGITNSNGLAAIRSEASAAAQIYSRKDAQSNILLAKFKDSLRDDIKVVGAGDERRKFDHGAVLDGHTIITSAGSLTLKVGGSSIEMKSDSIMIKCGGSHVELKGGSVTIHTANHVVSGGDSNLE